MILFFYRLLFVFSVLAVLCVTSSALAATYTVTKTADTNDGTCDSDCSLREAITAANGASSNTIEFNIDGGTDSGCTGAGGVCTISPTSALPSITAASMTINGYTQNSAAVNSAAFPNALNTTLKIVINGASAGSVSGLTISNVANCVIKGLAINGFAAKGIVITGSSATGNKIQGNFVGTDVTGETDSGNTSHGVWITSSSTANIIGTDGDGSNDNAERNLLSGNNAAGINMDTNCGSNTIAGNFIGTDKDGTTDLGNSGNGIVTNSGANSNFIGTDGDGTSDAVEGNVVSGNDTNGFNLVSNSNIIAGNLIGVNAAGTGAVKNGQAGISMSGNSNRIGTNGDGTSDTNERNVIGGHSTSPNRGIIGSGTGVIVAGNYIGIGSDGSTDLGNNRGIQIQADGWRIGTNGDGTADSAEANVISGNSTGVYVDTGGTNAVVAGNLIGLNAAGTSAVANDTAGIAVIASANNNSRIGTNADGTADSAERNIISGNGIGIGIENGATGVVVAGNYIGVDVNGNTAVANTQGIVLGKWDGSTAGSSNRIGTNGDGTNDTAERNVISGNTTGIEITNGSSNTIAGNYVGVGADGTTDVGNAGHGITFTNSGGSSNTIGGDIAAEANTIAYNGDASGEYGVRVAVAGSDGNDILRNSFFNNQDIGIKLNGDGANNDQAAPSITDQGTSGSDITLVGTSTASATVQIFEADSNSQEGKTWLGEATANGSGDWTFTLTAPYNEDGRIFVATATDATNGTSQFSASFTLANTTPVASSQTVTPDEDTSVTITLGLTDADGDTLTTTIVTLPASGALYQTADGATLGTAITSAPTNVTDSSRRVIYVPVANANGNGIGNFTFRGSDGLNTSNTATVTVNVTAVADSPTAAAQTVSLNEDTAKSITLAGSDPDGGSLTYAIVSNPSHGTLSGLNAGTGAVTYTPTANYNGTDAFSFWVYDGTTHSGAALVNLTISAVNDPPTASAQSVTVTESSTVITLSAVDVESSSLTFAIVSNPSHGALSALNASSGTVTYTPTTGYGGSDSFTFKANDGSADSSTATVRLTVDLSSATNHPPSVFAGTDFSAVEGAPSVLLGVATDEDGDSLTYLWSQSTGQTVSLTNTDQAKAAFTAPAPDGSGDLEFVLSVSDGTATATDSVRVRLARRNFTANDAALVNGRVAAASGGMVITREEGVDYKGREATAIDLGGGSVLYSSGSMPVGVVTLENAIVAADPGWRNNAGVVVMIDPAVLDEGTVIDLNNPKFAEKGGVIASYGNQDGNLFGYVVKTADVDGDGSSEILALAPGTSYGTLYVLSGDNLETRNMVLGSASEELKTSVLFTTDVNGADGDDLLIGLSTGGGAALTSSKGDRLLASVSPSASVWNGILGGSDLPTVYDLSAVEADFVVTAEGDVASADGGDLDGSGSEDLVLSASGEFGVDVIFGSSAVGDSVTSLSSANRLTTADSSLGPNDSAAVGDVTGDGYDDIVLGFSTAVGGKGKIVVVPGRSSWDANAYDIDYGIAINGLSGDAIGEWLILDDADGDGVVDIYTNAGTSGDSYLITLGSLIDEEAGGSGGGSDEEGGHLGPGGFGGCSLNNRSATIRSRRLLSSANTSWRIAVFLIATLIYSLWLRLLRLAMFTKVRSDSRWNLKTSTKTELLPVKISLFIFFVLTLISCGSARIPGSGDEAEEGGAGGSLPEEGEVFLTLTGKITQPTVDAELEALSKGMKGLIPRGFAVKRATASPNVACSVYDLGGAYLGGVTTGETGDFATTVAVSDTSDDATARIVVSCENGIHNFAETSLTEADLSAGSADVAMDIADTETTLATLALVDDWSGWGEDYSGEVISRDMGCLFAMNKAIFSAAEEEDGGLSDDNAVIKNVVEGFMADGGKPEDAGEEDWPALIHHVLDGSAGDGWENMVESAADVDDAIDVPEFLEKYDAASRAFGAVSGTLAEQIDALYADSETAGDTTTFEVCSGIESGTYEAKAVVGPMLVAEDEEEFSTAYGSPEGLRLHFNLLKNCREEGTCRDMADKPSAFLGFMAGFSGNYSGVFGAGTTPDENVVKGMFRIAENCTGVSAGNIRVCAEGMHTAVYQGDGWSAFQNSGGQFDGTKLNLWGDYWTRQAEIGIDSMTAAFNRMDGEISGTTGTLNTCISYLLSRGIYDTGACSLGRFFGSYATSLKQTGNTLGFEDPPTMVSALLATGQNLFGFEATDGVTGDDDSGYYWPQLIDLLEEARGTDLKIFATLREKHLTGTTANRWGVSGNSTTAQWAAAQVAAAAELGGLSVDYPNLVGFTIDDFSGYPCTVEDEDYSTWSGDGCYSRAQIRAITNAAHSANPNFKFWPTVYYPHLPWHIVPAHALGTPYGVRLYSDEYATVKYIFTLSSLPATAILKFHAADTNTEDIDYVDMLRKSLIINSQTVYDQSMRGDQHVETYNANIASYLQAGANTIAFKVSSTSDSNIYHHKMYYIWDVLLTVDGVAFTSWNPVYSKKESTASYTNLDNVSVTNAGKVFAKSTANYVITSDIDGILAPFPAAGGFYSAVPYADLVAKTKSALGDRDLITVNYGMMWGTAISNPVLDAQIRANALVADGIVVWNFPLPFYQLGTQGGIFQQYASDNPSFNLMSFFPGNQQGLEGWYQKWTTKERLSGAVTVKVKDDRTSDYSTDYFVKTLYSPDTGTIYYQDAIGGNEGTETVTINLGSTPVLLALKVDETDGVGNFPTKIWFHVTNSSGAPLVSTDFDFASGTTNNNIVQTYNTLKDAFLGLW